MKNYFVLYTDDIDQPDQTKAWKCLANDGEHAELQFYECVQDAIAVLICEAKTIEEAIANY
jgi:hypothetical protein